MAWTELNWPKTGIQVVRLCGNSKPVHKAHWPRVVILDLSADEFDKFDDNPLKFTQRHKLFLEKPILWMSDCAKPPLGKGVPVAVPKTRWTVTINHGTRSAATCAAIPQELRFLRQRKSH